MNRNDMIEFVAEYFGINANDDGKYDTDSYDWVSGCYHNGTWISIGLFVDFGMDLIRDLVDCWGYDIDTD